MKRIIFFIVTLFCGINLSAQNWDSLTDYSKYYCFTKKQYRVVEKTNVYNDEGEIKRTIDNKQSFESSKLAYVQDMTNDIFDTFEYMIGLGDDEWISTDSIVLADSEMLPDSIVTINKKRFEKKWIPVWYNDILNLRRRLEDYSDYYSEYKGSQEYSLCNLHEIEFKNTILVFNHTIGSCYFSISKIWKKNSVFYINCEIEKSKQSYFTNLYKKESFANLPDFGEMRDTNFIVEQNGNRLRLYNGDNYKLIIELMPVNKEWADKMIEYIESDYKIKPSGLNATEEKLEHPWSDPKTGLYESAFESKAVVSEKSNNVTANKTMSVSENLKLRSDEATSTQVLTVMSAGTKVKILELGKAETIDGISSNWVKVEVQKGAKDRDGNPIKAGTVGWCYSGYLE